MLRYAHRDRTDYWGQGAQDGHLDFLLLILLYVHRDRTGPLWTESPGRPPRFSSSDIALRPQRPYGTIMDGEPRTATSIFLLLILLYVHRDRTGPLWTESPGRPPRFSSSDIALRPQRPYGTIMDGEPRTSTPIFTLLLNSDTYSSSSNVWLTGRKTPSYNYSSNVLRPRRSYGLLGTGAQNVHLDFHTPEFSLTWDYGWHCWYTAAVCSHSSLANFRRSQSGTLAASAVNG